MTIYDSSGNLVPLQHRAAMMWLLQARFKSCMAAIHFEHPARLLDFVLSPYQKRGSNACFDIRAQRHCWRKDEDRVE